jgi:6-pyruvoyltetrahydropterin/6-carboxytetrahydropterin synthase
MFTISVTREFCAAHALLFRGVREPMHGHNFRVTVTLSGPVLDGDGVLCDFHDVEKALDGIIAPWQNANLQEAKAFSGVNPSAEVIARTIGVAMGDALKKTLPDGVRVSSVSVTEAAGCVATWVG